MRYLVIKMKIAIVGTGMFGFSLASHLGKKNLENKDILIMNYDQNQELVKHLQNCRTHLYHFGYMKLPQNITFTCQKEILIRDADVVIFAVVSQAIRKIIQEIKPYLKDGVIILNTAKALEIETAKTFYEVIKEEIKDLLIKYSIAKLSGGTFAEDMVDEVPLGVDIACENPEVVKILQKLFHNRRLRTYGNTDILGVEYAGAFKNVIAIFAGIINGLKLPYGSETHMISRAAKEAQDIAVALGANIKTFSMESQCWGNDLWMSCTGKSRNRQYGKMIGEGLSPTEAFEKMKENHKLVEGYYTVKVLKELSEKSKVQAPILTEIYKIIYDGKNVKESIEFLMNREIENIN